MELVSRREGTHRRGFFHRRRVLGEYFGLIYPAGDQGIPKRIHEAHEAGELKMMQRPASGQAGTIDTLS